jgi:hypothetical protein
MNPSKEILITTILKSLYNVTSRRKSSKFAEDTIHEALSELKKDYGFLSKIKIENRTVIDDQFDVNLNSNIENIPIAKIGGAIETLIRVICNDIGKETGLYFITEMKQSFNPLIYDHLKDIGVDLNKIQIEQQIAYKKLKKISDSENTVKENKLGYTWNTVTNWEHKQGSKYVTLYDSNGEVLDQIDLENAIKTYVEKLSGVSETDPTELQNLIKKYEKEYSLLKLIYEENMDLETAKKILKLSDEEVQKIIIKLIDMQILKTESDETVTITETGKNFLKKEGQT